LRSFKELRPVLPSALFLALVGGLIHLQAPYVVDFYGSVLAGPLEASNVAGLFLAIFLFKTALSKVSVPVLSLFLIGALTFTPHGVFFALLARLLSSLSGHFIQAKIETAVLSSVSPADQFSKVVASVTVLVAFVVFISNLLIQLSSYSVFMVSLFLVLLVGVFFSKFVLKQRAF